jgi:DNA-binding transcriptional LysR family regulator
MTDTRSLATGGAGVLRIGCHTSLLTGDLSASLSMFRRDNAGVEIEACELNRRALLIAVTRGELDIGVTAGRASSADLRSLCLWSEPLIAALPHDHALSHHEPLRWSDLRGATFVVSADDPGPDISAIINARLSSPGDAPDIRVQRVGRDNLLSFAEGDKIVIGTGFAVRRWANAPVLRDIQDNFAATSLEQCLVWRADNDNAAARRFLTMAAERYGRDIDA